QGIEQRRNDTLRIFVVPEERQDRHQHEGNRLGQVEGLAQCRVRQDLAGLPRVRLDERGGAGRVPWTSRRQVSELWATRGSVGVLEPPAGSRVTPKSCAPRTPDTSSVAPVLPAARTPALRAVPSLITQSW